MEKLGFHIMRLHLNVNNVHYDHALPNRGACYFHIYVGSAHLLPFKILNFNIKGVSRKMRGYEKNVDYFFGGSSKKRTVFGRRLYAFYGFRI